MNSTIEWLYKRGYKNKIEESIMMGEIDGKMILVDSISSGVKFNWLFEYIGEIKYFSCNFMGNKINSQLDSCWGFNWRLFSFGL